MSDDECAGKEGEEAGDGDDGDDLAVEARMQTRGVVERESQVDDEGDKDEDREGCRPLEEVVDYWGASAS